MVVCLEQMNHLIAAIVHFSPSSAAHQPEQMNLLFTAFVTVHVSSHRERERGYALLSLLGERKAIETYCVLLFAATRKLANIYRQPTELITCGSMLCGGHNQPGLSLPVRQDQTRQDKTNLM